MVVAANRDEATDRPSSPPALRLDGERRYLAPRDDRAGGTWIGVGETGVFAALTNRWTTEPLEGERSRGHLVRDAITAGGAREAVERTEAATAAADHAGFNMVIADSRAAWLLAYDGTLARTALDPGVHVVVNVGADGRYEIPSRRRDPGERQAAGANTARERLSVRPGESAEVWRERARSLLVDHDLGFCVHGTEYGTRSSSLVTISDDGSVEYAFADGPPCEVEHALVDDQL